MLLAKGLFNYNTELIVSAFNFVFTNLKQMDYHLKLMTTAAKKIIAYRNFTKLKKTDGIIELGLFSVLLPSEGFGANLVTAVKPEGTRRRSAALYRLAQVKKNEL